MSTAQMNLLISTNRIGTGLRANPVCGELPVPLTVVTVILAHTEDHLLVAIQEVVRCCLRLWREWWFRRGDCANTSRLQGYVAGALISTNASNNPSYGKTAFISFAVPAGATYQITSYPAQNYSCGSGVFSVFGYQT